MEIKNQWEAITSLENLEKAFLKARRGKQPKKEVFSFFGDCHSNLVETRKTLHSGRFRFGPYREFIIHEPKERVITVCPFHQRVVQHAIFNVVHPVFDGHLTDSVFASRPGMGTHRAIAKAEALSKTFTWFLKLDVRKYFETIPHPLLLQSLEALSLCSEVRNLFALLISSHGASSGMPIGNLASQYFANHYLSKADYWFELDQGFSGRYIRYMDDMVLFSNQKEELVRISSLANRWFVSEMELSLKPPCIQPIRQGLPFLGFVIFSDRTNWRKGSKKRFNRKIYRLYRLVERAQISQEQFGNRARALLDFANPITDKTQLKQTILLLERSSPNEG